MATETRKVFSCDFETTTKVDDCRVWAWGIMEIGNSSNYKEGTNIESFMTWCEKTCGDLYFHNLKFDGAFIVNWLLSNGYRVVEKLTGEPKTFTTMISSMGQWYSIDICYGGSSRKKKHTMIRDSLKKLPFSVSTIADAFNLEIKKGELDYELERALDHVLTEDEADYLRNDVEIIAQSLEVLFSQDMKKATIGSDAMADFKSRFTKKRFDKAFPSISLELDTVLRKAYRGGFTWCNPVHQGNDIDLGVVYDVVSLYPSQMYYQPLPFGEPIHYVGEYEPIEDYPLYIQQIICEFEIKEGFVPTIQIKKNLNYKGNEYLERSKERVTLYVTNVDLELIKKHYDLYEEEYVQGWAFRSQTGFFNEYIEYWMEVKKSHSEEKGALYNLAKLMLNNLYGKFATNPDKTGKVPYLKDDGSTGFKVGEEDISDPVYLPMGIFITSWARFKTISAVQENYDRIIYCDTDSMHLVGTEEPKGVDVHPTDLGKWSRDDEFVRARYLRQKTYIQDVIKTDKKTGEQYIKLNVKCAGMPDNIKEKVTFENFQVGFSKNGKLMHTHVKGGVVLQKTHFTLK